MDLSYKKKKVGAHDNLGNGHSLKKKKQKTVIIFRTKAA